MKKIVILAVLCFVTYCSAQTGVAYTLTADERAMFLNSHNAVRKVYGLDPLVWDDQLEKDSAAYALKCLVNPLTHSTQPTDRTLQYGENLSTYMARPKPASFPYKTADYHVVNGWYSEEVYWNCKTNACTNKDSLGKTGQCGHLTQIVWKATTSVGCGIASCPGVIISSKDWYVQNAVCRYRTAGNVVGWHPLDPGGSTGPSKCPVTPTTLGPFVPAPVGPTKPPLTPVTPVTPTAPVKPPTNPPTAPVSTPGPAKPAPSTPVKPPTNPPTAPVTAPATPVKPPTTPPTAPVSAPVSGPWWKNCIADYWPTDPATGKQYQKLSPCQWEPWKDTSGGKTWCCPNPTDEYDYSWPCYNLGKPECPDGKAPSYAKAEENADTDNGLPMGAWIGIAVAIAVVIIIVIVVIIIVQKKKNDERV